MFIKKTADKRSYNNDGYAILDTDLEHNKDFNDLVDEINNDLRIKINYRELKKNGGFIMGNFGIDQGHYGPKFYSLIFKDQLIKIFEELTETKLDEFDIFHGGNLVLPNKGKQHFHIDGSYYKKMYMVSIVTEDIDYNNAPTEICLGSHKKYMKFWEFFFSRKIKKKITLKKGQILIRPHNLWHRGTKNKSVKPRLLLSFSMSPKKDNKQTQKISPSVEILPNFFKSNFFGRLHEFSYVYFGSILTILKLINSLIKEK